MKVNIGDKFKLDGACQYGYTRDGIKIVIDPYETITKIKDSFSDHVRCRRMYRLDNTGWEINIDDSIVKRYFVRESEE